jgi:hypothetical protein
METMLLPNRLVAVVVLIAIGLLASLGLTWPARDVQLRGATLTLSGGTLLGLIVIGLAWAGADIVLAQYLEHRAEHRTSPFVHSILSAGLVAAALGLLARLASTQARIVGVLATCGLMALLLVAERFAVDMGGRWRAASLLFLRLVTYLVSTLLYSAIRSSFSAPVISAVAVGASSALLGLRLVGQEGTLPEPGILGPDIAVRLIEKLAGHGWLRAIALGALLGILAWFLGQWISSPLAYSLAIVVAFYTLVGITTDWMSGRLTRQSVLEHIIVGSLVVLLLLRYTR